MFLQFALTSQTGGVFKHSSSSNDINQTAYGKYELFLNQVRHQSAEYKDDFLSIFYRQHVYRLMSNVTGLILELRISQNLLKTRPGIALKFSPASWTN